MTNYNFLEGLTVADIAFEAFGKTLEEVFTNAALALAEVMVNPKTVELKVKKMFSIQNDSIEQLLYDFLEQLIILKDSEGLIFTKFEVKIRQAKGALANSLSVEAYGEKIDPKKHELDNDAKAITYHEFKLEQTNDGWRAQVIVDI